MKAKVVSIDFQKDFTAPGGQCYKPRPSVNFVKNTLVPYLETNNLKLAEIISDYRLPRPGRRGKCCRPGEPGYESEIPESVKEPDGWIKCTNSPLWVRKNIGNPAKPPGLPYQDPKKFDAWIARVIGTREDTEIILVGLTLDCCVLCAAQEFSFRGFTVKILKEAVDAYSGSQDEKDVLFESPIKNWAEVITWEEAQRRLA